MLYPYQTVFLQSLHRQGLAATTIYSYDQTLNHFFNFLGSSNSGFISNPSVDNIFDRDIDHYFATLRQQGQLSPTTENKLLSQLNRYFQYLFTHQLTSHLPTIALHGPSRHTNNHQPSTKWLTLLPIILSDEQVHYYTRLTLLLLSQGYEISEVLQPGFYHQWKKLVLPSATQSFRESFNSFIAPIQARQRSQDLFLKQRLDLAHPQLTNAALHKYLNHDSAYLGFPVVPTKLHQSYILAFLQTHSQLSDQALQKQLRLDPQALLYYQRLRMKLNQS